MNNDKRAVAFVNLSSLKNNILRIKNIVDKDTSLMLIVKANAYGHGAKKIADFVQDMDFISYFGCATATEALDLRNAGIKKNILILGYVFDSDYENIIKNDVTFTIFDEASAIAISNMAVKLNKVAKIHIKIDTGMGRIGFYNDEESRNLIKKIYNLPNLDVNGIFTHFARADEKDKKATIKQIDDFNDCIEKLKKDNIIFKNVHCSNSAAIVQYKNANMNMVRSGILAYGLSPSDYIAKKINGFEPILSIESTVIFVKDLKKGRPIGYGGTYIATKNMKIATIPIGYADGYPRSLSNQAYVLIHGKKCNVVGKICMDQFMVDVTHLADVSIGDKVIIVGKLGDEEITIDTLSKLSGRLNYEIVCHIGFRVNREYINLI